MLEIRYRYSDYRHYGGASMPVAVIRTLADTARLLYYRLACKVVGHKLIDEGYATPDSGCVDLHCTRCDWGFRKTLY